MDRPSLEPLEEILRDRIRAAGPVSFRDFMEAALHHPRHGYYGAGRVGLGRDGDFFTSSHVHPAFGELIGLQIAEMAGRAPRSPGEPFWILEAGPGRGHLAVDISRSARAGAPGVDFRLGMIEPSAPLRRVQRRTLETGSPGDTVEWYGSLAEAAGDGQRAGCLVANEVLDALPVHRVVMRGGRLREIFVDWRDGGFREREEAPGDGLETYLAADRIELGEGQQAEINLEADAWVRDSAALFRAGYLLLIDYGRPARELYAPERLRGTLICYHRHRTNEDFYRNVGAQDMTAHLNLSALIRAGGAAGWRLCGVTDQMRFLISLGILNRIEAVAGRTDPQGIRERLGLRQLIQPGGMGEIFRVLLFRRGPVPADLRGIEDPFRMGGAPSGGEPDPGEAT